MPGETNAIDVTLHTTIEVAEAQNVIVLGPEIRIAVDAGGQPFCMVNPEINMDGTFTISCDLADVCTLEAFVFALDNVDAIPSGSILYTCEITIDLDSVPGTYPLTCAGASADDPDGDAISTACVSGSVLVFGEPPLESPTPTRTLPPTPVATKTATAKSTPATTATRTRVPGSSSDDDDACQVTAPKGTGGLWLLALPAAVLCLRRKRTPTRT
jgi:hypothetical protein